MLTKILRTTLAASVSFSLQVLITEVLKRVNGGIRTFQLLWIEKIILLKS